MPGNKEPFKNIPFSKVSLDGDELKLVKEVMNSGWLTTASKTKQFEEKFASMVNAKFACAVNSCTAALHLALEALGVGPDDKVLVPTMTFTSSAEVVRYLGADPVFLDVEYRTGLITPQILKEGLKQNPDVKVLIIVHFGGQPASMASRSAPGILEICREHGIKVVEDAAHAFPARCGDSMIGSLGDVTCFSFYANKTITTGEGGMLTTNDESIANRVRVMRLHGIDRDVWDRHTSTKAAWEYDVIAPGYKYNMPDICAAIGLAQLDRAYDFRAERERCAKYYYKCLGDLQCLDLPLIADSQSDHAWHLFPIIIREGAPVDRDEFIRQMADRGIGTSVHYKPLHRMSYYKQRYLLKEEMFPNAEKIWMGCVSLPIYPSLTESDLAYICASIRYILKNN